MPLKTNMTSLVPRRQAYRKEITLLSKGYSNRTAWPGGRLIVYPWDSVVDEYLFQMSKKANRNAILFGLIEKLADLNGGSVDDFVATEINSVLLTSRALSVANTGTVRYSVACPVCKTVEESQITVPDELEKIGEKDENYQGFDDIILPDCKDVLRMRPLLIRDERFLVERSSEDRKGVSDRKLRSLLPITTVNDTRPDNLNEMVRYYDALSPRDLKFLEEQQEALFPHLNIMIAHQCDECGTPHKHPLGLDTEFFVEEARLRREARWRLLFGLAWDGKGLTLDISQVPDDILMGMAEWRNERVEEENRQMQEMRTSRS